MGMKPRPKKQYCRWVRRHKKNCRFMKSQYPYVTTNDINQAEIFRTKSDAEGPFWIEEDWEPVQVNIVIKEVP